jgi:hypothetical protein
MLDAHGAWLSPGLVCSVHTTLSHAKVNLNIVGMHSHMCATFSTYCPLVTICVQGRLARSSLARNAEHELSQGTYSPVAPFRGWKEWRLVIRLKLTEVSGE